MRVGEVGDSGSQGQQGLWALPKVFGPFVRSFLCFLFWSHLLERHRDLGTKGSIPNHAHLGDDVQIRHLLWEGPSTEESWDTILVCDPGVPVAEQNQGHGIVADSHQGLKSVLCDALVYTVWRLGLVPIELFVCSDKYYFMLHIFTYLCA